MKLPTLSRSLQRAIVQAAVVLGATAAFTDWSFAYQ